MPNSSSPPMKSLHKKREEGIALLITLLILSLLVILIVEVDSQIHIDLRAAGYHRDATAAYYLAKGGVSAAMALLKDDARHDAQYDALTELWATPLSSFPVGDGVVSGMIIDENRKMNVNTLVVRRSGEGTFVKDTGPMVVDRIKRLFDIAEVSPDLVDAIVDWMDSDDGEELHGAEVSYYEALPHPYFPRNAPLEGISELRLIKGIDAEVFRKISPYLTAVPISLSAGSVQWKINVNTAESAVLRSLDVQGMIDEGLVERIIANRPFDSTGQFRDIVGQNVYSGMQGILDIKSTYFSIYSQGEVNDVKSIVAAVARRNGKKVSLLSWKAE